MPRGLRRGRATIGSSNASEQVPGHPSAARNRRRAPDLPAHAPALVRMPDLAWRSPTASLETALTLIAGPPVLIECGFARPHRPDLGSARPLRGERHHAGEMPRPGTPGRGARADRWRAAEPPPAFRRPRSGRAGAPAWARCVHPTQSGAVRLNEAVRGLAPWEKDPPRGRERAPAAGHGDPGAPGSARDREGRRRGGRLRARNRCARRRHLRDRRYRLVRGRGRGRAPLWASPRHHGRGRGQAARAVSRDHGHQ